MWLIASRRLTLLPLKVGVVRFKEGLLIFILNKLKLDCKYTFFT